jgi:hypothetical protein
MRVILPTEGAGGPTLIRKQFERAILHAFYEGWERTNLDQLQTELEIRLKQIACTQRRRLLLASRHGDWNLVPPPRTGVRGGSRCLMRFGGLIRADRRLGNWERAGGRFPWPCTCHRGNRDSHELVRRAHRDHTEKPRTQFRRFPCHLFEASTFYISPCIYVEAMGMKNPAQLDLPQRTLDLLILRVIA